MNKEEMNIGIKILEEQELERKRIARELHDSTVQNLTTLIHKTELCSKLIDIDPIRAQLEMHMMSEMIRSTVNEMRDIIFDLRPMALDDLGLTVALERFATQAMMQHEVKVGLNVKGKEKNLLPVVKTTLFRIITEACNNAIRHGKTDKVTVFLNFEKKSFYARIEDRGCGFEINEDVIKAKNFGISIMEERTHLLKGSFHIQSEPGMGTAVEVKVPNLLG